MRTIHRITTLSILIILSALAGTTAGCQSRAEKQEEQNEATFRAWWERNNKHDADAIVILFADNVVVTEPGMPEVRTRDDYRQMLVDFFAGFPDGVFTLDGVVSEGDMLVNYWTFKGTHTGEWGGIPATGKQVEFTGTYILRFDNGKVVESRSYQDILGLLQQLGALG